MNESVWMRSQSSGLTPSTRKEREREKERKKERKKCFDIKQRRERERKKERQKRISQRKWNVLTWKSILWDHQAEKQISCGFPVRLWWWCSGHSDADSLYQQLYWSDWSDWKASVCDSQTHAANGLLEEDVSERTVFIHVNILEKQAKRTRKRCA